MDRYQPERSTGKSRSLKENRQEMSQRESTSMSFYGGTLIATGASSTATKCSQATVSMIEHTTTGRPMLRSLTAGEKGRLECLWSMLLWETWIRLDSCLIAGEWLSPAIWPWISSKIGDSVPITLNSNWLTTMFNLIMEAGPAHQVLVQVASWSLTRLLSRKSLTQKVNISACGALSSQMSPQTTFMILGICQLPYRKSLKLLSAELSQMQILKSSSTQHPSIAPSIHRLKRLGRSNVSPG